jgi:phosphoenolpyruvate synthase/pyruvate phosphate dikinase
VERHFGSPQDVEWAIARDGELPSSLFVLQSRPVTAGTKRTESPKAASAMSLLMSTFGAEARDPEGTG